MRSCQKLSPLYHEQIPANQREIRPIRSTMISSILSTRVRFPVGGLTAAVRASLSKIRHAFLRTCEISPTAITTGIITPIAMSRSPPHYPFISDVSFIHPTVIAVAPTAKKQRTCRRYLCRVFSLRILGRCQVKPLTLQQSSFRIISSTFSRLYLILHTSS